MKHLKRLLLTVVCFAFMVLMLQSTTSEVAAAPSGWSYHNGWYYTDPNGHQRTGWIYTGGHWYYLNGNGLMQTGWVHTGGRWYYLNSDGSMRTGWVYVNGSWFYLDNSGAMYESRWVLDGGEWYYLGKGGYMKTGWLLYKDRWYYMNGSGQAVRGWHKVGAWYYFDNSCAMQTGWIGGGNYRYYMTGSGAMQTGWAYMNNRWYYFLSDGRAARGINRVDGKEYYFGEDGIMLSGWQRIDGKWYFFGGHMMTGWIYTGGKYYYADASGVMQTGWIYDGGWYYMDPSNGHMCSGWCDIGDARYYLNAKMVTGWCDIGGKTYYFHDSGKMATGTVRINGKDYYFGMDGVYEGIDPSVVDEIQKYTPAKRPLYFVDISEHNGKMDFEKLKKNADGVILRMSWGHYAMDKRFEENLAGVKKYGIPYGVYHYSYALNLEEAKQEATGVITTLKRLNARPDYPVFFDMEDADNYKRRNGLSIGKNASLFKKMCVTFCDKLEAAGFSTGVYASKSWFDAMGDLSRYHIWLAHWDIPNPSMDNVALWQYTARDNGKVVGTSGQYVDGNYAYIVPAK